MRRERRFNRNRMDIKRVLYICGGIVILSVITFFAVSILNTGNKNNSSQLAKFNTSILNDYTSNSIDTTEEASSDMGKTINEVQQSEVVNDVKQEEENSTENTVKSSSKNTVEEENKSNSSSSNSDKEIEKEEKVKDPEFQIPVEGKISKKFAQDNLVYSTTLDEWITHNGIDIEAEKTEVVKAAEDGVIKSIKNDPRYGLTVVIEHANGFTSVYSNLLTAEFIEEGENIKKGQSIATVGNTAIFEIADESHLHFEILKDNKYVDPELYIK